MYSAHVGSFTILMTYGRPKCLLASAPSGEERRPQCSIRAAQPARRPLWRACEGLSGRSRCNPVEATLRVPAHRELRPTLPARGDLAILVEGDKRLFNQYGVMLVNPAKHSHVKAAEGQAFIDWLVSGEGQKATADYKIEGQPLFFPNAGAAKGR